MSLLLLLNPAVTGVDKFYTNANGTGIWSDSLNWSATSGGPQDTVLPTAIDDVFIDSTQPLTIDGTQACASYTQTNSANLTINGSLAVGIDFVISDIGALAGVGTVNIKGNITITENAGGTNSVVWTLDGTGTQNVDFGGAFSVPGFNLIINKVSGVVNNISDMNEPPSDSARIRFTITAGTFNGGAFDCVFFDVNLITGAYNGGSSLNDISDGITISGGTYTATTDRTLLGRDFTKSSGTFVNSSGLFEFIDTGGNSNYDCVAIEIFFDVIVNIGNRTFDIQDQNIRINNSLISNSNSTAILTGGTVELVANCDFTQNGEWRIGTDGLISFEGVTQSWISNITTSTKRLAPISVSCTTFAFIEGTPGATFGINVFTWLSGTIVNSENITMIQADNNKDIFFNIHDTFIVKKYIMGVVLSTNRDMDIFDELGADTGAILRVVEEIVITHAGSTEFSSGILEVEGKWTQAVTSTNTRIHKTQIKWIGTNIQELFLTGGNLCGVPVVNKSGGSLKLQNALVVLYTGGDIFIDAGTLDINGQDIKVIDSLNLAAAGTIDGTTIGSCIEAGQMILPAGTFIAPGEIILTGGDNLTSPITYNIACNFNANNGVLILRNGDNCGWSPSNLILHDVIIDISPTGNFQPVGGSPIMVVENLLTLTAVNDINVKIEIRKDITGNAGDGGTGELKFNGTVNQSIFATGILPGFVVDKAAGILTQEVNLKLETYITYINGDVDFLSKAKTTTLVSANNIYSLNTGDIVFFKLVVTKEGSSKYTLLSDLKIDGDFVVTGWIGSMDFSGAGKAIRIGGNLDIGNLNGYAGNADHIFTGSGDRTFKALPNDTTQWDNSGLIQIGE